MLQLWCTCVTEIYHAKWGFYENDLGQAEKQLKISKYNAKLIKYSPQATISILRGALGAPEGGFGGGGAVFDQFGIVFAHC